MSRAPHEVTDVTRGQVEALAGYGFTHDEIGSHLGISEKTLRKHYRKEIDGAVIKANALVARSLHKMATSGNTAAAIFWMKARAGWREKASIEISGPEGGPLEFADATEKLLSLLDRKATPRPTEG